MFGMVLNMLLGCELERGGGEEGLSFYRHLISKIILKYILREKCPNMEVFLVRIFLYSD